MRGGGVAQQLRLRLLSQRLGVQFLALVALTPALKDPVPSSGLQWHCIHVKSHTKINEYLMKI